MGAICSAFQKEQSSSLPKEIKSKKRASVDSIPYGDSKEKETVKPSTNPPAITVDEPTKPKLPEASQKDSATDSRPVSSSPEVPSLAIDVVVVPRDGKRLSTSQPIQKPRRGSHDPRILDEPPDLRYCSEEVRSLLLGRVHAAQIKSNVKEVTIYVCSNFIDAELENSTLQKSVFPALRHHAAQHGHELSIVNLHYGVYGDCLDDHSYRELCLETLESLKTRSNFILLVLHNNKVDKPLLPRVIGETEFNCAIEKTQGAINKDLLNKWYLMDDNALQPCYVLQPIREHIPKIVSEVTSERKKAMERWRTESNKMVDLFNKVMTEDKRREHLSVVFEEEIKRTVIENNELAKRCILLRRKREGASNTEKDRLVDQPIMSELESLLPDDQKLCAKEGEELSMKDMCDFAESGLKRIIETIIAGGNTAEDTQQPYKGMEEFLYQELVLQWSTSLKHAAKFIGKQDLLNTIKQYLEDQSSSPLIIHGPVGSGKTGLMSKTAYLCSSWMPNTAVVFRHVGITTESSTQEQLLRSISEHCCVLIGDHPSLAFKSIQEHSASFEILLKKATSRNPLILMIDGLDQVVSYSSRDISWIPTKLPRHVKFILSIRDESHELKQLKDIFPETCFLSMPTLTAIESMAIVDEILNSNKRRITGSQRGLVKNCLQECAYPRYARLLGYLAVKWHSIKMPDRLTVASTTDGLVEVTLNLLEEYVGSEVLGFVLGVLGSAKHGLTDEEMLDVLSCEETVLDRIYPASSKQTVRRFPSMTWQLIKRYILPFINIRIVCERNVISWKNQYYRFRCWEHIRQLNPDKYRNSLMEYFEGKWAGGKCKPLSFGDESVDRYVLDQPTYYGAFPNKRKLYELPFYCLDQNCPNARANYLFNPDWIITKCRASDPYELLEDIALYIKHNTVDSEVYLLKDVVHLSSYALRYDSSQFYTQFYSRLKGVMSEDENIDKYPSLKAIYALATKPPFPSLLPLTPCLQEPLGKSMAESKTDTDNVPSAFTAIYTMKDYPFHVVTISTERGELAVWDVYRSTSVRKLTGLQQPRDIKFLDNDKALVLCNRELVVYDLNLGKIVVKMKGIMNQKMPYYGVKDNTYVVSLSRNRMYVNVMSLSSGDLETTFKVGEDRFLNSLLVSDNGQICVCGDETQKPFPLLVWNLTDRKLIYDLRIPQHEFLTNLTAISTDGRYLVSVCRELPLCDSSPNSIVVYELESGTVFKKWKPDMNTCGIAISHTGNLVVNSLENGLVLVWDLETGARKHVLQGHTAPADQIRIDDKGNTGVTYDSVGRDRSIRMWDLTNGECLSVFTPDQPISCCQLSSDGKAVVLGLGGHSGIVTLILCHRTGVEDITLPESTFGDKKYTNLTFDVSETPSA